MSPINIGSVTIKNRIVFPSICTFFCNSDGTMSEDFIEYVISLARGGIGLITIGGNPHGEASAGRPIISEDKYIPGWTLLANEVHKYRAKLFCQLHPVSVYDDNGSALKKPGDFPVDIIQNLVESFAAGAARCQKAGADGVEIEGCHERYLADFLSPYSNDRTDEYGGSVEGRAKMSLDIVRRIKEVCGKDYPIIFKIVSDEMVKGGLKLPESIEIIKLLEKAGIDAVHVSIGRMPESSAIKCAPMDMPDCLNIDAAKAVKNVVNTPVIAVNRIVTIEQANDLIDSGYADMAAMGRAHLADPELVNKYLGLSPLPPRVCIGCNQGCRIGKVDGRNIRCMQNPFLGRLHSLRISKPDNQLKNKKIIIVGAGPAGLEAACVLAENGIMPQIYEKSQVPGGLINLAKLPPFKENMDRLVRYRIQYLQQKNVCINCGVEVTPEFLAKLSPDIVILATGSTAMIPPIAGLKNAEITTADEFLSGVSLSGERFAVLGGGLIGCETAESLAASGKKVEIFEMQDDIAIDLIESRRYYMLKRINEAGINVHLRSKVLRVALPDIEVENSDGKKEVFTAFDGVIVATGRKSYDPLNEACNALGDRTQVIKIGDVNKPSMAIDAIRNAAEAVCTLMSAFPLTKLAIESDPFDSY